MPAPNYINTPDSDFSLGMDSRSAENQIQPGFVRDLLNADVIEKRARKRKGYQGYAGGVPVRAQRMAYDSITQTISFTLDSAIGLDSSVSLQSLRSSPLVVQGRSSLFDGGDGPFVTGVDNAKYYPGFSIISRKQFIAPSGTLVVPGGEHGLGSANFLTEVVQSTDVISRSYEGILPNSISINESTYDISIGYNVATSADVITYYRDNTTSTGQAYVSTVSHTGSPVSQTFTVTAGTHALDNFNIVTQVYQEVAGSRTRVIADAVLLLANGDVQVTLSNDLGTTQAYYILLSAAPIAQSKNGVVGSQSIGTVTITNSPSPWAFLSIYLEQSPGGVREEVLPDTVTYDDPTNTLTISFTNEALTARNFIMYYQTGEVRSNILTVSDTSVTDSGVDLAPQITIWGFEHSEIYASRTEREGWVTHIDSYRRPGQQEMVCGLGGNFFEAQPSSLAGTSYLYPTLYPMLSARVSSNQVLGPLLYGTGALPGRSRGYVTSDASGTHWATVTSVQYDTGSGNTIYTLSVPGKQVLDSSGVPTSLSSVISTTPGLEDYLTVAEMSYRAHEGVFRITQVVDGVDSIEIWVDNPANLGSDYDDLHTGGNGGVFTDQYTWTTPGSFVPGDVLQAEPLGTTLICTVVSSLGSVTVSSGLTDTLELPSGLLFTASRISNVVPLRTGVPNSISTVTNLVRGDMLSYTGIDRQVRVRYVNPSADQTCNITSGGTLTLTSGTTQYLTPGQQILLTQAGVYSGVVEISNILSPTVLEFDTKLTAAVSGAVLLGNTMEIDEELSWADTPSDSNRFQVEYRWIPIEAPDNSFDLPQKTYVRNFNFNSYTNQPFLRSGMVTDNMYLTNYDDTVQKFDGESIYRAGLLEWQPGALLTQETTGAVIVAGLRTLAYTAIAAAQGKLTITAATSNTLPVGTIVKLSGSGLKYTVTSYTDDGTNFYALMDRSLDSDVAASGTAFELGVYRYYYRLNAVDINNNVVASAATSSDDYVIELSGNAAVQHKLVGMPAWDNYDYARLEVQIYRTKKGQAAPFYLVTTFPMDFDNTIGYISFRDAFADSDLSQLDPVNTALKGTELGRSWTAPLRAKYTTTTSNKLVLANLQDYPQLDLQIVSDSTLSAGTLAGGTMLFKQDITDPGTTCDMVNRAVYQWVNGFSGTLSAPTIGTDTVSYTTSVDVSADVDPGDWMYLTYDTVATTGRDLTYCGWYQVGAISGTTVTFRVTGAAAATTYPNQYVFCASNPENVPVLLGVDGSMGMVGDNLFTTFDAMRRMSLAINASMRMVDVSIGSMAAFVPWIVARGGNDLSRAGGLVVRQPKVTATQLSLTPTFSGYNLFINSVRTLTGAATSAATRLYPSRIIASYQNFPEIFDNPTSVLDTDSDSAIDVNSADGQQITGVIPFFGVSAFTAAQEAAVLLVFKANSIYLVDLRAKAAGQDPVQKLETQGLGCTAPYSIAATKNGIMFANEGGIYCLRSNHQIEYIGRYMERNWGEQVDLQQLGLVQGHHFSVGRSYKLSVPISSTSSTNGYMENSQVYVYNHTGEEEGRQGAWSRYDNHPATGWANLASDAFFGATSGRVFVVRQTGATSDYRDDAAAITLQVDTRANDFGNAGIRKVVDAIIVHYRSNVESRATSLDFSVDLSNEYSTTNPVVVNRPSDDTNLADTIGDYIVTVRHKLDRRRGVYFSIRILSNGLDESMEIAGIEYKVAALTDRGILQASQTVAKAGAT